MLETQSTESLSPSMIDVRHEEARLEAWQRLIDQKLLKWLQ